ncbi:hypothetical protein [Pseudactinotalea sp. Z1748]|uniref:hypothetical protein n=1 Tax=Pseudactinotalea sp. Z1748 TaxID=3413027 RepID=UPI003C7B447C
MSTFTIPTSHQHGWTLVNQDTGLGLVWSDDIAHLTHLAEEITEATGSTYALTPGCVRNAHTGHG